MSSKSSPAFSALPSPVPSGSLGSMRKPPRISSIDTFPLLPPPAVSSSSPSSPSSHHQRITKHRSPPTPSSTSPSSSNSSRKRATIYGSDEISHQQQHSQSSTSSSRNTKRRLSCHPSDQVSAQPRERIIQPAPLFPQTQDKSLSMPLPKPYPISSNTNASPSLSPLALLPHQFQSPTTRDHQRKHSSSVIPSASESSFQLSPHLIPMPSSSSSTSLSSLSSLTSPSVLQGNSLPPPPTRNCRIIQVLPGKQSGPKSRSSRDSIAKSHASVQNRRSLGDAISIESPTIPANNAPSSLSKTTPDTHSITTQESTPTISLDDTPESPSQSRKAARKTAHSLIERRRRSKMNDAFRTLREIVPACADPTSNPNRRVGGGGGGGSDGESFQDGAAAGGAGIGMHKLAILEATVEYVQYLEHCVDTLKRNADGVSASVSSAVMEVDAQVPSENMDATSVQSSSSLGMRSRECEYEHRPSCEESASSTISADSDIQRHISPLIAPIPRNPSRESAMSLDMDSFHPPTAATATPVQSLPPFLPLHRGVHPHGHDQFSTTSVRQTPSDLLSSTRSYGPAGSSFLQTGIYDPSRLAPSINSATSTLKSNFNSNQWISTSPGDYNDPSPTHSVYQSNGNEAQSRMDERTYPHAHTYNVPPRAPESGSKISDSSIPSSSHPSFGTDETAIALLMLGKSPDLKGRSMNDIGTAEQEREQELRVVRGDRDDISSERERKRKAHGGLRVQDLLL